ncbi:NAD(P)-dependent oxidoreductase [Aquimarina addita]|uniref:NAD(P)-dependent oxidoreductase n=1 Tax=Aquimarina addita TaxID=870485 RepID=A0ABP6UU19_9FLAO
MNNFNDFFLKKKVVVTGASGFIGSHLVKELNQQGAQVYAFVRNQSDLWRLPSTDSTIHVIKIDLLDSKHVQEVMRSIQPNYIFHFAIPPHSFLKSEQDLQRQIHHSTQHLINLFTAVKDQNIPLESFIHACSGAVYHWEPNHFIFNESTSLHPTTLRGRLKLSQRNICLDLGKSNNIQVKIARIFRAYGPWEIHSKLIIKALEATTTGIPIPLGHQKFKRDYIFINDLIEGILKLAATNVSDGIEMNFGSSAQYSASEIITLLEKQLGREVPKQLNAYPKNLYDQGDFIADCSLAKQQLNWEPTTSIEQGLMKTIQWYQAFTP